MRRGGRRPPRPRGADAPDRAPARAAPAGVLLGAGADRRRRSLGLDLLRHADPPGCRRRSATSTVSSNVGGGSCGPLVINGLLGPFNFAVKICAMAGRLHRQPGLALPPVGASSPRGCTATSGAGRHRLPGHRRPAVLRRRRVWLLLPAQGPRPAARLHPGTGGRATSSDFNELPVVRDADVARLRARLRGAGVPRAAQPGRHRCRPASCSRPVAPGHPRRRSSSPPSPPPPATR